jgi:hypothetical protein
MSAGLMTSRGEAVATTMWKQVPDVITLKWWELDDPL